MSAQRFFDWIHDQPHDSLRPDWESYAMMLGAWNKSRSHNMRARIRKLLKQMQQAARVKVPGIAPEVGAQ